ncbi:MAG: glycosyltransferase [Clostridiales bacterium]|nr:glycosyltransferase [Clostridiales bacterium]
MKLSVVIPVYNESEIVEESMRELAAHMAERYPGGEVIFVNDGSTDNTAEICSDTAKSLGEEYGGRVTVRALGYEVNKGKGHAVRTGMLAAAGDCVLFTDCDFAYGLDIMDEFTAVCPGECDVAAGSRAIHPEGFAGYSLPRIIMSKVYLTFVKLMSGYRGSDSQTGIKAFSHEAARAIFSKCGIDRFAFDLEALLIANKFGFSIKEIPVSIVRHRPSHINFFKDTIRMLKDIKIMKGRIKKL